MSTSIPQREWSYYKSEHDAGRLTQDEIARQRGITQAAVSKRFKKMEKAAAAGKVTFTDMPIETVTLTPPTPQPQVKKIKLAELCLDAGTQMRAESMDLATIADYAYAMSEMQKFPPIIVFSDGDTHWLADGYQRVEAIRSLGYSEIDAEVRPGSLRDAILFACGANSSHGLRRTDEDKHKSVLTLMRDAEWSKWSDNKIAGVCGVSQTFTSTVRRSLSIKLSDDSNTPQVDTGTRQYVTKHGTTATMDTSKIGRRATGRRKAKQSELSNNGDSPESAPEVLPGQLDIITDEQPHVPMVPNEQVSSPDRDSEVARSCATCAEVLPLITEATAQLGMLGEAAHIEGYTEYRDLEFSLWSLRRAVEQAVRDA